jgi:DNA transformation protein
LPWPSRPYLAFVLEQLANVRRVSHRRMFRGVGLYSDDVFFAVLDNETMFFKVNDQTRPRYEQRKMPAFAPIPGKPPMRGYFQVPPGVLEDVDELTIWANEAITVGGAAAPPKRRKF